MTTRVGVLQIAISNVVQDENGGVSSDAEMDGEDEDGDGDGDGNENEDEDEDEDEDERDIDGENKGRSAPTGPMTRGRVALQVCVGVGGCMWVYVGLWVWSQWGVAR